MRAHIRTIVVVVLALALLGLFLRNVDFIGVAREIVRARPGWLFLSLLTIILNLVIRAWRWQFLLEPLGKASFGNSFRATAVGFGAAVETVDDDFEDGIDTIGQRARHVVAPAQSHPMLQADVERPAVMARLVVDPPLVDEAVHLEVADQPLRRAAQRPLSVRSVRHTQR